MPKIKVNIITNKNEDGAVELTQGATIPADQELTVIGSGANITGIMTASNFNASNANVTGVVTATSFIGSGANLTNLPVVSSSKIIAYKYILGDHPLRA
jgi:hypothetical protein